VSKFDVDVEFGDIYQELDRLAEVDLETVVALEGVLAGMFQATQQYVHVITGSLRGSGNPESEFSDDKWTGEITYGGASPGFPKNPVTYARHEQGRGPGHDFLRPAVELSPEVGAVVKRFLEG
jgi:hypothetical protein